MAIKVTAPSKTFLLGEYIALTGGPALLICTEPRFELIAEESRKLEVSTNQIHPASPAGKLINENINLLKNYKLDFIDPHNQAGGLGASSAQFVLITLLVNYLKKVKVDYFETLATYHQTIFKKGNFLPSGADVIAQLIGQICFFYKNQKIALSMQWPFPDLSFCLIRTGNKVPTHEHLNTLSNFNFEELTQIALSAVKSFESGEQKNFTGSINEYSKKLQEKGLVIDSTLTLIDIILRQKGVLAAKGCGALGADVIFVLLRKDLVNAFLNWAFLQKLSIISHGQHFSRNAEIESGV